MKKLLTVVIIFLSLVCKGQNLIYTDGSQNYFKSPNKKAKVYPTHSHQLGIETCFTTLPPSYSYQCSVCKKEFNTLDSFFVGGSLLVPHNGIESLKLYGTTYGGIAAINPPIFDTIPVIMLVCDTAKDKLGFPTTVAYSIWGFCTVRSDTWDSLYLDADKKPLPKSIIVWVSKTLN